MRYFKELLKRAADGVLLLFVVLLLAGAIIIGTLWLHNEMFEVINNRCYTNVFGEVICKIKQ